MLAFSREVVEMVTVRVVEGWRGREEVEYERLRAIITKTTNGHVRRASLDLHGRFGESKRLLDDQRSRDRAAFVSRAVARKADVVAKAGLRKMKRARERRRYAEDREYRELMIARSRRWKASNLEAHRLASRSRYRSMSDAQKQVVKDRSQAWKVARRSERENLKKRVALGSPRSDLKRGLEARVW